MFQGLGCYQQQCNVNIQTNAISHTAGCRKIPLA